MLSVKNRNMTKTHSNLKDYYAFKSDIKYQQKIEQLDAMVVSGFSKIKKVGWFVTF